jgi:hypothetical protein
MWIFLTLVGLTFWSFSENLSLIPLLLVSCLYDGGTKCLELDIFYNLVIDWTYDLLWLQPQE